MNVSSTSLDSLAAGANDVVSVAMLRKAIDQNASAVAQLLEGLPQKANAGTVVDVQI